MTEEAMTDEATKEETRPKDLLIALIEKGDWGADASEVLTEMLAVRPYVPEHLAEDFERCVHGDEPAGPVIAGMVRSMCEGYEGEIRALDELAQTEMSRKNAIVNAMLGVENGIPLMSPDDELKLADMLRQKAGLEKKKLTHPVELTLKAKDEKEAADDE